MRTKMTVNHRGHWQTPAYGVITGKTCTRVSTSGSTCVYRDLWHLATELKLKKKRVSVRMKFEGL